MHLIGIEVLWAYGAETRGQPEKCRAGGVVCLEYRLPRGVSPSPLSNASNGLRIYLGPILRSKLYLS